MTRRARALVTVGWLLTPVVAWAASFLGGWIGAALTPPDGGVGRMVAGGVLGAVGGVVAWLVALRYIGIRYREPTGGSGDT